MAGDTQGPVIVTPPLGVNLFLAFSRKRLTPKGVWLLPAMVIAGHGRLKPPVPRPELAAGDVDPPRCTSSVYAHAGVSGAVLLHGLLPSQFLHSYFFKVSAKKLGMSHLSDSSLRGMQRSSFTESAPLPHGFLTFVAKCVFSLTPTRVSA